MVFEDFLHREWPKFIYLTIGGFIQGIAMSFFLFPHGIPSGGAAGLALIFNYWFQLPLGFVLWLVNFSLLVLAIFKFGNWWTVRTMYSVSITAFTVSLTSSIIPPHVNIVADLFLGGALFGLGVGILIRNGASSGGMVIPALLIAEYKGILPGKVMFWVNLTIFILTATVISLEIFVYAVICQWFSTKVIDFIYKLRINPHITPQFQWRNK
ncbi:uncharacterized membrane-anchored protein YitT (DUF2179 family) [Evansella vedderi]|uniref:Uncharacterized membrane-anchored protein YitT (DUF2179 family) n=1 Tax=Evansella vedderi TaxID=38282 RepID=A0ABU0A6U4_9BACI|nr:YitT family protein [Evansella vedderi]MDQ0258055.1 uncharacterized membrane-anchored protein YitT (DUF2179 family) [Evansella vedderi]